MLNVLGGLLQRSQCLLRLVKMNTQQVAMAHQSNDPPYNQLGDTGVFVVNQQPQLRRQFQFPIRFQSGPVLAVSIVKCIIGSLQFLFGIINIIFVPFFTSYVAFPIWCGLLFLANGVIGCILRKVKSKCLIAAFCGLSIASLVLTVLMLVLYVISLVYFIALDTGFTSCGTYGCSFIRTIASSTVEASIGLLGFLMLLILIELGCSIAAVFYSCKAYSKCCSTCLIKDCCACVGCCECDTRRLNDNIQPAAIELGRQNFQSPNQYGRDNLPRAHQQTQQQQPLPQPQSLSQQAPLSQQQLLSQQRLLSHQQLMAQQQLLAQQQPLPQQLPLFQQQALSQQHQAFGPNPCSALLNVIINMPGASYLVDTAKPGQNNLQVQTTSSAIHPRDGMQPHGSSQHTAEEKQAVNPSAQINPNFTESSMMGAQKM
ncbi:uncharacterized protein LOC135686373 isoform X2 [Rhopilema esculentum]|uniref:uncharacterized protein LOC135686373 isoform X2 n=1 Tax=Rhopilema esculentum TaxID=499914 RepID=UPI0031DBB869